mmetsp:Transcript_14754/g.50321  ORF Transcript_14754/g.50321 Transcript_14754/m.50321 type:complete len:109 (+) Transcript_14754:1151-1477(+)
MIRSPAARDPPTVKPSRRKEWSRTLLGGMRSAAISGSLSFSVKSLPSLVLSLRSFLLSPIIHHSLIFQSVTLIPSLPSYLEVLGRHHSDAGLTPTLVTGYGRVVSRSA